MATKKTKKKAVKKKQAIEPIKAGEVVTLPCGGTITVEKIYDGVVIVDVTAVMLSGIDFKEHAIQLKSVKLVLSDNTLEVLPVLARRILKRFKK